MGKIHSTSYKKGMGAGNHCSCTGRMCRRVWLDLMALKKKSVGNRFGMVGLDDKGLSDW